jgi:hypothetical protein
MSAGAFSDLTSVTCVLTFRLSYHNLKVIGPNPIPATRHQALENMMFSGTFCCPNFELKSLVEASGGKSKRKIGGVRRDVTTQT